MPSDDDDAPPAWKLWAGCTLVLVLALIATPSEIDNGDICPRPAGWLIVHPLSDATSQDIEQHEACNGAAPKRGIAAGIAVLLGGALTLRSHRRQDETADV